MKHLMGGVKWNKTESNKPSSALPGTKLCRNRCQHFSHNWILTIAVTLYCIRVCFAHIKCGQVKSALILHFSEKKKSHAYRDPSALTGCFKDGWCDESRTWMDGNKNILRWGGEVNFFFHKQMFHSSFGHVDILKILETLARLWFWCCNMNVMCKAK